MENSKEIREDLSDEILFSRFKNGDQQSFDILLKRYERSIFNLVYRSVNNYKLAEEVFQDIFFKVVDKADLFKPTVSFKAWLYTIARNTCIDKARRKKRRPNAYSIFIDEEKPTEIKIADEKQEDANEKIILKEHKQALREAVKELTGPIRETFLLRIYSDLAFEEIAKITDCSINTAKSRMRYAFQHLQKAIKEKGLL